MKLISNEVEEFICKDEREHERPTVFGVVRLGKGKLDRLTVQVERGTRKKAGIEWESYRGDKFQRAVWRESVKWIRNLERADGTIADLIDDPKELEALWEFMPGAVSEVVGFVQGMSILDEDEEGNSGSVPDSEDSEEPTESSGVHTSATTADSTG